MPKGPVIKCTGGSTTLEFDGEVFKPQSTTNNYNSASDKTTEEEHVLTFSNREARITSVEVTSGDKCGTVSFKVVDGKCTIRIITEIPDEPATSA